MKVSKETYAKLRAFVESVRPDEVLPEEAECLMDCAHHNVDRGGEYELDHCRDCFAPVYPYIPAHVRLNRKEDSDGNAR